MSEFKDITGQTFGRLTVVRRAENTPTGHARWVCSCACGRQGKVVLSTSLVGGRSLSCGCNRGRKAENLIGQTFGRLTVTGQAEPLTRYLRPKLQWFCVCQCGREVVVVGERLRSGNTKSCGCISRERSAAFGRSLRTHGESVHGELSPEYRIWLGMKARCERPSEPGFTDYGARGIRVCDRWRDCYEKFLSDMGRRPTARHSIDRIDVNGHYEPSNCRWATPEQQARNRRNNHYITFEGETLCIAEWSERLSISAHVISARINSGWSPERALTTPLRPQRNRHVPVNAKPIAESRMDSGEWLW